MKTTGQVHLAGAYFWGLGKSFMRELLNMKRSTLVGATGGLLAGVCLTAVVFVAAPSWAFRDNQNQLVPMVSGQAVAPNIRPITIGQPNNLADLVEQVSPSVVQIIVHQGGQIRNMVGPGSPFGRDGGPGGPGGGGGLGKNGSGGEDRGGRQQTPDPMASGSGFIIDGRGYIVTNNHVVEDSSRVTVRFKDGNEVEAEVVGTDERTDLAVIKVTMQNLPGFLTWGDSEHARPGDSVFAVGSPFGLGNTVTAGIVSARGRDIGSGPYDDYIQVDAPINQGNSGGPLFNTTGKVIGVNSAIYSPSGGNVGIGFSIPADLARSVVDQIIANGSVSRGWLGVSIESVTRPTAASIGLADARGALVQDVTDGSPAARAGLRTGDVILQYGDHRVENTHDLTRAVAETRAGQSRPVRIFREGREQTVSVTIADLETADGAAAAAPRETPTDRPSSSGGGKHGGAVDPSSSPSSGGGAVDVDPLGFSLLDAGGGVTITDVDARSTSFDAGIRTGDRLLRVGQTQVTNAAAAAQAITSARGGRDAVLLQIERQGTRRYVGVQFSRR
jgi:serine protease Do